MKIKYSVLSLLMVLIFLSCDSYKKEYDNPVSCSELRTVNGITTLNEKVFSGSCLIFSVEGKKINLKSFRKGIPHGVYKGYYYPTENLEYIGYRKNGEIHGEYVKYHNNGSILTKGTFRKGLYINNWFFYDENNNLIEEKRYNYRGILTNAIKY